MPFFKCEKSTMYLEHPYAKVNIGIGVACVPMVIFQLCISESLLHKSINRLLCSGQTLIYLLNRECINISPFFIFNSIF